MERMDANSAGLESKARENFLFIIQQLMSIKYTTSTTFMGLGWVSFAMVQSTCLTALPDGDRTMEMMMLRLFYTTLSGV
jgi:hypothetical protein